MRTVFRLVIAVLLLPTQVPVLVKFVQFVIKSMTNNAWYPNPVPSLAEMTAATDALDRAETDAKTRARGMVEVREDKRRLVLSLLKALAAYVQRIADANPGEAQAIILSSGFPTKKPTGHGKPPFEVKQGRFSGEVILIVKRAAKHASYDWEYGTDQKTWITVPSTLQVKRTINGLTPGTTYWFRFRTVTKAGEGDWSQSISFLVK